MIKAIIGRKGSGKTKTLLKDILAKAQPAEGEGKASTLICIESGDTFDREIPINVRLIKMSDYPLSEIESFLAFLYGLAARDYDISDIFIDSIYRCVQNQKAKKAADYEEDKQLILDMDVVDLFKKLHEFSESQHVDLTFTLSLDEADIPEELKALIDVLA